MSRVHTELTAYCSFSRVYRTPAPSRVGKAHVSETRTHATVRGLSSKVTRTAVSVLVREADLNEPDPEVDDAIEEFDTEPEDEGLCDQSETVQDEDMSVGSFNNEETGDFAEISQLPKIFGEEEMIESILQPEGCCNRCRRRPYAERQSNEQSKHGRLPCVYEYNIQMPQCSSDVVLEEDHDEELSKTPFRVIDEYYGNV